MLLASNTPSEAHSAFLAKKARDIAAAVFKIFWPSAKGSLHHACCVLDYLLRSYADEVLTLAYHFFSAYFFRIVLYVKPLILPWLARCERL